MSFMISYHDSLFHLPTRYKGFYYTQARGYGFSPKRKILSTPESIRAEGNIGLRESSIKLGLNPCPKLISPIS